MSPTNDAGATDRAPTDPAPLPDELTSGAPTAGESPAAPAADAPHKRRRRPLTLRTKLIGASVLMVLLVCGVTGVATELYLSHYLTKQVDDTLTAFTHNNRTFGPDGPPAVGSGLIAGCSSGSTTTREPGRGGPGFRNYVTAIVVDGSISSAGVFTDQDTCVSLTPAAQQTLLDSADATTPRTVDLDGYGAVRVIATTGYSGATVITGLPLDREKATTSQLARTLLIVMASGLIIATAGAFVIIRRTLRPLDRVAATAQKVATMPLHRGEVDLGIRVPEADTDPRTEVGQVGAALNQMLGHVSTALERRQASEMQVRRFVADASHELRTPLAAIRGYTELARRAEVDAATVSHALSRVDSESVRMSALVDDLLLLARLDAGRPLGHEEVDLTLLAMDVVSDARVAGPDHHWRLDLPEEPITVTGDEPRLHQVIANLLTNARTHTPPGTTVTTGIAARNGEVELTVTDNGPGIDAALLTGIFGRFVRGDSSRSRGAGSTGLGLSIVQAVVMAHGGTVIAESLPGRTVFTVRLATR